jgi:hypothetical protein
VHGLPATGAASGSRLVSGAACRRLAVLGGGLSGLAAGRAAADAGADVEVFEAEDRVGGLAASRRLAEGPHDLGGGRFLLLRDSRVTDWAFGVLPRPQWRVERPRIRFRVRGRTRRRLPARPLLAAARHQRTRRGAAPDGLADWLRWAYGPRFSQELLEPFCERLWGVPAARLGVNHHDDGPVIPGLPRLEPADWRWLARTGLTVASGRVPVDTAYPREGGMQAFCDAIADGVPAVRLREPVEALERSANGWLVNGRGPFDRVVSTVPPAALAGALRDVPPGLAAAAGGLRGSRLTTACFVRPAARSYPTTLTYVFDHRLRTNRVVAREGARGWTVAVADRAGHVGEQQLRAEGAALGLGALRSVHHAEHAFPVYAHGAVARWSAVREGLEDLGLDVLGRWGGTQAGMDVVVLRALEWVDRNVSPARTTREVS